VSSLAAAQEFEPDILQPHGVIPHNLARSLASPTQCIALSSHYEACGAGGPDDVVCYMDNKDIFQVCKDLPAPMDFFKHLHAFPEGSIIKGSGLPLYCYPNFYTGQQCSTVEVLCGSRGSFSSVHVVRTDHMNEYGAVLLGYF
jgi:hypothetical protein